MNHSTAAAVSALIEALKQHPEDLRVLQAYGDIPTHLIDLIEDYEDDLTQELKWTLRRTEPTLNPTDINTTH